MKSKILCRLSRELAFSEDDNNARKGSGNKSTDVDPTKMSFTPHVTYQAWMKVFISVGYNQKSVPVNVHFSL